MLSLFVGDGQCSWMPSWIGPLRLPGEKKSFDGWKFLSNTNMHTNTNTKTNTNSWIGPLGLPGEEESFDAWKFLSNTNTKTNTKKRQIQILGSVLSDFLGRRKALMVGSFNHQLSVNLYFK